MHARLRYRLLSFMNDRNDEEQDMPAVPRDSFPSLTSCPQPHTTSLSLSLARSLSLSLSLLRARAPVDTPNACLPPLLHNAILHPGLL
jgi:hypothetical protein